MGNTQKIKDIAKRYGFLSCKISKAEFLESEAPKLERWLQEGMQGSMGYMENYFDKRLDPTLLLEDSKSVISLSYNYYPATMQGSDTFQISKYAYGKDYHKVIKKKLQKMVVELQQDIGAFSYRVFVDSAPVLEKAWAVKSGLAWQGKNGNVIIPQQGSFYFLAEIICDLELHYDFPIKDYCGSCTKCIESCPTQAIVEPYVVDGSKCISYFTIELKDEIPTAMKGKFQDWMFGCDICQDVCPWNRFSTPHKEEKFNPKHQLLHKTKEDWEQLSEEDFDDLFRGTAVKRTKYKGLQRNIFFLAD